MPRGDLDFAEQAAGAIVAEQLGGRLVGVDIPGACDGVHDFDIELTDGRHVALEVTSAGVEDLEALKRVALEPVREEPTLGYHWWLSLPMDSSIRVKPLTANVGPHLEVLEQYGIEQVRTRDALPHAGDAAEAARAIFALGADRATRLDPKPGEVARLMASLHGGAGSDFDSMNDLVAESAQKKVKKLLEAPGDEKHLFVWIRSSAAGAELAIATLPAPEDTPPLPGGIDVVWVGTGAARTGARFERLLRLCPPGAWETIAPHTRVALRLGRGINAGSALPVRAAPPD
ncbi:MAG TPA: hypothetical protein VII01_10205 [Solirubrobacteraceae bacterium]